MHTDRSGLPLSTASQAARDAYVAGCTAKLTAHPGARAAFDRAIAADPGFALPHAAMAHLLLESGDGAGARAAMAAATARAPGLTEREASHIAFLALLVAGDAAAALAALRAHLESWPRDALILSTTASTNGLIGSSGAAGQKRALSELLEHLAPGYAGDWWFAAHRGMALSETGQHDAAEPIIAAALAGEKTNPWAAHATAHLAYERGDPAGARGFLGAFLARYPRDGALFGHLSWHLALAELQAGATAAAWRLFRAAFAPGVHGGPLRSRVNDPVAFLWRCELAGLARDAASWRATHDFAIATVPRAGVAFSDLHVGLAQIVAADAAGLAERAGQRATAAAAGRYPAAASVSTVLDGFAAFERGDLATAIAVLTPAMAGLERIGGSHAQLDLVRFTLLRALVVAGDTASAEALARGRRAGSWVA